MSSLLSFVAFFLLSVAFVSAASTRQGPTIPNAGGVAVSADGSLAFVHTTSTTGAAVYAYPLPFGATSNPNPTPYFVNSVSVQYYFIQVTATNLIYLLDNQNGQLVSLQYSSTTPATNTTLVYNFATPSFTNVDLVDEMYLQRSTGLVFLSLYDHFNGATYDYIAYLNPNLASPVLTTLYTTSFVGNLAGVYVSNTRLYFGTYTSVIAGPNATVAAIYYVPLASGGVTPTVTATAQVIYTTTNANLATSVAGNLIYPSGFMMNAQESILYVSDIGNQNSQAAGTPHAIYAIWPITFAPYVSQLNLTTIYSYTGPNTEVQQSIALSPDQGTVYFAATGAKNGLYITSNANTTFVGQLPTAPIVPTLPATSAVIPTSAPIAATSAPVAPTSAPVVPTSAPVVATSPIARTSAPAATSAPVSATSAPVFATSGSSGGVTRPPFFLSTGSAFAFSDAGDALGCLSSNANGTVGVAGSDGGDIFVWSLTSVPATINPSFIAGTGSTGASFIACQADPAGRYVYLLDTRGVFLYRYFLATPNVAPAIVSTFSDEATGTLTALAIDFVSGFAYVGTRLTDFFYSVPIATLNQNSISYNAQPANSDITSLALSPDGTTLYYGFPAPAQGVAGGIASIAVQAGAIPYSTSPTTLVSLVSVIYPDSIVVNGTGVGQTLYYKDGGPLHGLAGPGAATTQTISSVSLAATFPTTPSVLFTTTTLNLPPGLILTSPVSVAQVAPTGVASLIFTTALTIDFLSLLNSTTPVTNPTTTPATSALATSAPATSPLVTSAAATSPAATSALATSARATSALATSAPATSPLVTSAAATSPLATSALATSALATSAPATSPLVTSAAATSAAATSARATSALATSALATSAPATSPLVTSAAATSAAATSAVVTSAAATSAAATSAAVTSAAATSARPTSAAATSALATSAARGSSSAGSSSTGSTAQGSNSGPGSNTQPPRVVGDPMFVGFLRQRYQVHGMDGVVYNILSQASVSINALFVFLESGACPIVDGVVATNCWSHPGSYFGSLALQTAAGDQLEIVAGGATQGFSAVRFDGETVKAVKGVEGKGAKLSFSMLSTHAMEISIDNYRLVLENSDLFLNLVSIEVLDWQQMAAVDQPHGLLGQTWKPSKKGRGGQVVAVRDVAEGDVDDYVIASDSVFGTDFVYNKFVKEQ